jgi:arylsulfatase A-like enzyme
MRWPGKIPAGSINHEITGIIDMLSTFCALAGIEVPSDRVIDGRNILPYMLGAEVELEANSRPIGEVPKVSRSRDKKYKTSRQ